MSSLSRSGTSSGAAGSTGVTEIARYGGDEFVVLVQQARTPEAVDAVIRRLQDATRQDVSVGEHPVIL